MVDATGAGGTPGAGGVSSTQTGGAGSGGSNRPLDVDASVSDGTNDHGVGDDVFDVAIDRASGLGMDVASDRWLADISREREVDFDSGADSAVGAESGGAQGSDGMANRCGSVNPRSLIADFTSDGSLNPADGRAGSFLVFGDQLGTFDPPKVENQSYPIDGMVGNPSCSGPGSFRVKAAGFRDWGATISAYFVARPDGAAYTQTYDASKYRGVSFWAKGAAPITNVMVSFPDVYTDGGANPMAIDPTATPCMYVPGSVMNCSPYLVKLGDSGFPNYRDFQIDTTWRRFDILFADTKQDPYNPGYHTAADILDVHHLTRMDIEVRATYVSGSPVANDFEIWIDDVRFID